MAKSPDLTVRLPDMSDEELISLKANADRLAESGTDVQKAAVASLLPALGAELAVRSKARAEARKSARDNKRAKPDDTSKSTAAD
jgi:hypothetical protein